MTFDQLNIMEPILRALAKEGYSVPTPIQAQAIPPLLEGRDLQGCAQTGTGKTAAFAIPILQNLSRENRGNKGPRLVKSLILAPTRELAIQIGDSFTSYGRHTGLRNTVIFGGVSQKSQTDALRDQIHASMSPGEGNAGEAAGPDAAEVHRPQGCFHVRSG